MIWRPKDNNAKVLAALVVGLSCLVGYLVGELRDWIEPVNGALLGAAVSIFAGIVSHLLGTREPRGVPLAFFNSARDDVIDSGYYKSNLVYELSFDGCELRIDFQSKIVPVDDKGTIKRPKVSPPEIEFATITAGGSEGPPGPCFEPMKNEYFLDGIRVESDAVKRLRKELVERGSIYWKLTEPDSVHRIIERHTSTCPVYGFTLNARLPTGYRLIAVRERGTALLDLDQTSSISRNGEQSVSFHKRSPWFSRQGVIWKIEKREEPAPIA